jgi:hypothetical protein
MAIDPRNIEVIDDLTVSLWRQKSPFEHLRIASSMYTSAREYLYTVLPAMNPDWDRDRLHREALRRMHGATDRTAPIDRREVR